MHDGSGRDHQGIRLEVDDWNSGGSSRDRSDKNNPKVFAEQLEQCEGLSDECKEKLSEAFREGHKFSKGYDYANQLAFSWLRRAYDAESSALLDAKKGIAALKPGPRKRALMLAIPANSSFFVFRNALLTLNYPLIRLKTKQAVAKMAVRDDTDQYYERFDDILQRVQEYFVSSGLLTYDPDQKYMFSTWLGDSVSLYTERAAKEIIFGTGYVSAASNVRRARLKPGNEAEVERLQDMRLTQAAVTNPYLHTHSTSHSDGSGIVLDNTTAWSTRRNPLDTLIDELPGRIISDAMLRIRPKYRPMVASVIHEELSYRDAAEVHMTSQETINTAMKRFRAALLESMKEKKMVGPDATLPPTKNAYNKKGNPRHAIKNTPAPQSRKSPTHETSGAPRAASRS